MPVYLLHGFRWPRAGFHGIRVYIIMHNLDDCSAEYIQNRDSQAELLKTLRNDHPALMKELDPAFLGDGRGVQFLEQYDPEDERGETAVSQPFAFVGDRVVTIAGGTKPVPLGGSISSMAGTAPSSTAASKSAGAEPMERSNKGSVTTGIAAAAAMKAQALSLNIEEVVAEGPGLSTAAWEAFADLRDHLAPGEKIGWWVVYNGDPDRRYDMDDNDDEVEGEDEEESVPDSEVEEGEECVEEDEDTGTVVPDTEISPTSARQSSKSLPFPEPVQRQSPPQPTPKPAMFELSGPTRSDAQHFQPLSPLQSPPTKGSGKRQPGMKAAPQPHYQQPQPQPQPPQLKPQRPQPQQQRLHQQEQDQPGYQHHRHTEGARPRILPKSESLRKLFGKRS